MDGWKTIKEVRLELREATALAKAGNKSTAFAYMKHATTLMMQYCNRERGPDHGFERGSGKSKKHS